jgi:phosphoglycerate dehydrogenase-like enzyme
LQTAGIDIYPDWLFDGPVVTSARGAAAVSIAEYVLGAILSDAKRMPEIWIDGPERWTRMQLSLLSGQTLGLVGFGAIGEALAPRALALGMKVLAARRSQRPVALPDVERVATVGELAERSDVLVLAAPATAETHQILNGPVLARAKPGLHVINIARGSLVDDAALLQALDAGKVRLATLDVCSPEPAPAGHPYYSHPKVRLSPHISAFTPDSRINVANGFVDNLKRFRAGAPLNDVVDFKRGY